MFNKYNKNFWTQQNFGGTTPEWPAVPADLVPSHGIPTQLVMRNTLRHVYVYHFTST